MRVVILIVFVLTCHNGIAQNNFRYSVGVNAGSLLTMSNIGSKEQAKNSGVRFLKPMGAIYNFYFDYNLNGSFRVGLDLSIDQFDFGYEATSKNSINVVSSGDLTASDYIYLYKAGIRLGYFRPLNKVFDITGTITPSIGYYPYSTYLDDTSQINNYDRTYRPPGSGAIQYIHSPAIQSNGLHFLTKFTAMLACKISKHFSLTLDASYQQGFSNFVQDNVNIKQYDYATLQPIQDEYYYTKINGTSFQFHFGMRYLFNEINTQL